MKRKWQWLTFAGSAAMCVLSWGWLWVVLSTYRKPIAYPPDGSHGPTPGIVQDTNTNAPPIVIDGPGGR